VPTPAAPEYYCDWLSAEFPAKRRTWDVQFPLKKFIRFPGQVTELVALNVVDDDCQGQNTVHGFFDPDHLDVMAAEALRFEPLASGIFFRPNPINPALLARCPNRVEVATDSDLAKATDVIQRGTLVVSVVLNGESRRMPTDDEKRGLEDLANEIGERIRKLTGCEPLNADGGAANYLYFPINLRSDDCRVVENILRGIQRAYQGDPRGRIDLNASDPAYPLPVFGTSICVNGTRRMTGPGKEAECLSRQPVLVTKLFELYYEGWREQPSHFAGLSEDEILWDPRTSAEDHLEHVACNIVEDESGDDAIQTWTTAPLPLQSAKAEPMLTQEYAEPDENLQAAKNGSGLVVANLSLVTPKKVEWLWPNWIPAAALSLIDGDPGMAKSTVAMDLAARLTTGRPMPFEKNGAKPRDVIILSAEDDAHFTIRPRADAAGADVRRIHVVEAMRTKEGERPVVLPFDFDHIEWLALYYKVALIIIDPVPAYIGSEIDTNNDASTRKVLHRLKLLCERTGATVLMIRHLNKDQKQAALYRGGGSMAFVGAARAAMIVGQHPRQPDVKVLAMNKMNLGPMPLAATYRIVPAGDVAKIEWLDQEDLKPDEIIGAPGFSPNRRADALAAAKEFLVDELSGGPVEATAVFDRAEAERHALTTIKRAKKDLGIRSVKRDDRWFWELSQAA
jgi:hypothetical protein